MFSSACARKSRLFSSCSSNASCCAPGAQHEFMRECRGRGGVLRACRAEVSASRVTGLGGCDGRGRKRTMADRAVVCFEQWYAARSLRRW